jgi:hypothetical protein
MRVSGILTNYKIILRNNIFYLINIATILSAYVFDFRAGIVASIIILLVLFLNSRCLLLLLTNKAFLIYIICNLLSLYAYLFNGRPISLYIQCISYNIIPSLLFLVGGHCATYSGEGVFRKILNNNIIIMFFGLVILFVPSLSVIVESESIEYVGMGYRFGSYLSSLVLGSVVVASVTFLFICKDKISKIMKLVFTLIIFLTLVLTMQRGAWIAGSISAVLCFLIYLRTEKRKQLRIIVGGVLIAVLTVAFIYFIYQNYFTDGFKMYFERRLNSTITTMEVITTRDYQWKDAISVFAEYPLGFGLGAAGNKASAYGLQIVPDGNYFRILVELGIFGFLSFVVVNVKAIIRSYKKNEPYYAVLLITFLLHAIGTNVFDFYYSSFIYWFALGYISCIEISKKKIDVTAKRDFLQ